LTTTQSLTRLERTKGNLQHEELETHDGTENRPVTERFQNKITIVNLLQHVYQQEGSSDMSLVVTLSYIVHTARYNPGSLDNLEMKAIMIAWNIGLD
jgi:hypothetical protein